MCGICGKIYFDSARQVDGAVISSMSSVLQHRGPDDHGIYVAGPVGLGHQRLSIIDTSTAGHQPMSNEDGSIWIVFNGESLKKMAQQILELRHNGSKAPFFHGGLSVW